MSSKNYEGISRVDLVNLKADLSKEGIVVPDGDDVTLAVSHGVVLRATYDETAQVLTMIIVKKPFFIPESTIWNILDTGVAPYLNKLKFVEGSQETYNKHPVFRHILKKYLIKNGYSREQSVRLVGKLGDGQILAFIEKWGPTIIRILMMILPLFVAQEAPETVPSTLAELVHEEDLAD